MAEAEAFFLAMEDMEELLKKVLYPKIKFSSLELIPEFEDDIKECEVYMLLEGEGVEAMPSFFQPSPDEDLTKAFPSIPESVRSFIKILMSEFNKIHQDTDVLLDVEFILGFESMERVKRNSFGYFR